MKYKLTTLRDVFEKVPLHKVEECMGELTALLIQCKAVEASMKGVARATTGDANNASCKWPEPVTWIDDSKGDIGINVTVNGDQMFDLNSKV